MKIVIIEPLLTKDQNTSAISQFLEDTGHEIIVHHSKPKDQEEIIQRGKDAQVIIVCNTPINKQIIEACPKLKLISVAFTGYDHIDLETCDRRKIAVCNAPGYATQAVAELTIGLIISLYRKLTEMEANTRNLSDKQGFLGKELSGKTVGIVGTGEIGSRVASLLKPFGCSILAHSKTNGKGKNCIKANYVSLEELLTQSDIVTLHLPLKADTKLLIGESQINMMKESAILINTSRGQIIDNIALAKALVNSRISGAALDVYDNEPPLEANNPLLSAPNTILIPHIGYATEEAIEFRAETAFENVLMWEQGNLPNLVNNYEY